MNRVEYTAQRTIPGRTVADFQPLEHAHPVSPVLYTPVAAFATGYLAAKYVCTFWGSSDVVPSSLTGAPDLTGLSCDDLTAIRHDILCG